MTALYTRDEAHQELRNLVDWVGDDPNHEVYQAAVLLLLGLGRRKHLTDLTRISGYPKPFVQKCLINLRASGVWRAEDKRTWADWNHVLGFTLDVMVAVGIVQRLPG